MLVSVTECPIAGTRCDAGSCFRFTVEVEANPPKSPYSTRGPMDPCPLAGLGVDASRQKLRSLPSEETWVLFACYQNGCVYHSATFAEANTGIRTQKCL